MEFEIQNGFVTILMVIMFSYMYIHAVCARSCALQNFLRIACFVPSVSSIVTMPEKGSLRPKHCK